MGAAENVRKHDDLCVISMGIKNQLANMRCIERRQSAYKDAENMQGNDLDTPTLAIFILLFRCEIGLIFLPNLKCEYSRPDLPLIDRE